MPAPRVYHRLQLDLLGKLGKRDRRKARPNVEHDSSHLHLLPSVDYFKGRGGNGNHFPPGIKRKVATWPNSCQPIPLGGIRQAAIELNTLVATNPCARTVPSLKKDIVNQMTCIRILCWPEQGG